MVDAGLIVLVSFISPFRAERRMARDLFATASSSRSSSIRRWRSPRSRDPKGLYKKARRGELQNFTGIDSPYEAPEAPEVHIDTTQVSIEEAAESIVRDLAAAGVIEGV